MPARDEKKKEKRTGRQGSCVANVRFSPTAMRKQGKEQLIANLQARVRELEDLYQEATGRPPPPSSLDLGQTPRKSRTREVQLVSEDMAAITHPIMKQGKTARDKRMEVLAATQDQFVDDLEKLWSSFLVPLRDGMCSATATPLLEATELAALLETVSALVDLHRQLRQELDARVTQWVKGGECVGDVMVRFAPLIRAAHRLSPDQQFVTINSWRTKHAHARDIDALIRSAEKSCGDTLSNLMLQPVMRLTSYTVILEEMLVHTPAAHPDRAALSSALALFREIEAAVQFANDDGVTRSGTARPQSTTRLPPLEILRKSGSAVVLSSGTSSPAAGSPRGPAAAAAQSNGAAGTGGTLRARLQHSLSAQLGKVGDGLRKRSGTAAAEIFSQQPAAATPSSPGSSATGAGSPGGSTAAGGTGPVDLIEPLQLSDALAKLFHPEGCEEEFENVFLGLFHYFMSWNLFVNRFGTAAKQVREIAPAQRTRYANRVVQVATKWLRLNQHLRGERMDDEEARVELENFLAREVNFSAPSDAASGSMSDDSPRVSSARRAIDTSSPRETRLRRNSSSVSADTASPRALELDYSDDSSDEGMSAPSPSPSPSAMSGSASTPPPAPMLSLSGAVPLAGPSSPLRSSQHRIVMGSKKRASMFQESQTVSKAIVADRLEDLDKHLGVADANSDDGPPMMLHTARESSIFFVTVMDEWVRSLPAEDFLPLIKYWDQWRFPKKTRTERRDSLYYRSLQKSKQAQAVADQTTDFLSLDPLLLAKQMTLQELNTFKCISRKELCKRHFMEAETGPHFQFMVAQFNLWTGWVLDVVLKPDGLMERATVIGKLIEVADACHELSNFNSSYAIVAGLTHPQLARLKLTWDVVNKASMKKFGRLLEQWDVSANYKRYRDSLKSVAPPCVPYLGLLGKDLFSIEENSKTLLPSATNRIVVNFKKLRLIWSTVSFVENLQQYEYPELSEDAKCAGFLAAVKALDESAAKSRSRLIEPRAT